MRRLPLPPFTAQSAAEKVRLSEGTWNMRDRSGAAMSSISRRNIVVAGLAFSSGRGRAFAADRSRNDEKPAITSEGTFPSLAGATGWLNSAPLSREALRGKTVLVNFWTYSCINWMHAHPYVRAWSRAYVDKGLVTIGVHTPEFDFERSLENVRRAAHAN